ncbi:MAG TPA: hypothetical protein VG649_19460 [Candidatus Angelobacter sp.]|nr:hypothetical protein [Candidatus Angelobacter sp.]
MGREQDVDDFVAAKASDFNKSQQLSMSGVQQIQYQSVKNRRFLQTSIRVGIWFGTKGVGGSNPLSPTNSFNGLHAISGMPPSAIWQRPCSHSSVSVSLPFELAQRFFVSFLFEVSLMEFGFDFEERRQLGYKVIDRVNEYFDSLPNRPVQLPSHQRTFSALDETLELAKMP